MKEKVYLILIVILSLYVLREMLVVNNLKEEIKKYEYNNQSIWTDNNKLHERVNFLESEKSKLEIEAGEAAKLRSYLDSKGAPIAKYSSSIVRASRTYNVDSALLTAVSMAESGGCRQYIVRTNNCFGWGSGLIYFNSIPEAINKVAEAIGTSKTYRKYQQDKSIATFASIYNRPYAESYTKKLSYFMEDINK